MQEHSYVPNILAAEHMLHMPWRSCRKRGSCDRKVHLQTGFSTTRTWEWVASTCMQQWRITFFRRKEAVTCTCPAAIGRSALTATAYLGGKCSTLPHGPSTTMGRWEGSALPVTFLRLCAWYSLGNFLDTVIEASA